MTQPAGSAMPPFRVGLTGGIASGKSAVARAFAACGVPVVDTDRISREVVAPGTDGLKAVAETFGQSVLCDDGTLDRGALGRRVFSDPQARRSLEALLHPRIRRATGTACRNKAAPWVLVVVPLLFETGMDRDMHRTLVVDTPEHLQIERLCAREGLSPDEARSRLDAQLDRATRCARADGRIGNEGPLRALGTPVARLHVEYLRMAREARGTPGAFR